MNEQRQKELQELLKKHSSSTDNKPEEKPKESISISDISGSNNHFYINNHIENNPPKKNK